MAVDREERGLGRVALLIAVILAVAGVVRLTGGDADDEDAEPSAPAASAPASPAASGAGDPEPTTEPTTPSDAAPAPAGARIFGEGRMLVAYYGTGGTGALGVLGETDPDTMHRRLMRAAGDFARPGREVLPVYELIVTVADRTPGRDRDYSHDISREVVREYIDAAHRNGALLLLDLQPGRSRFVDVAKRWEWALRDPRVGLAIDPEWRMAEDEVPGTVIGSVGAEEVNRTTTWLTQLQLRHDLPEKLFVVHQFRTDMVRDIDRIERRPRLAMVQHVDGFGTPGQKLDTYRTVARPRQFHMGFKLFYDEDSRVMSDREVRAIKPAVRFVSFQ